MIWYSPKLMHTPVIKKLRNWLVNSTFATKISLFRLFIYFLQKCIWGLQFTSHQSFHQTPVKYIFNDCYIYEGTLGTIILWAWTIMLIYTMHRYLTYWGKQVLKLRISWCIFLILFSNIFQTVVEVQEHTLYFINMGQLAIAKIS